MKLSTPHWLAGMILPLTLGVAWEIAVRYGWVSGRLMPPPSRLAESKKEKTKKVIQQRKETHIERLENNQR